MCNTPCTATVASVCTAALQILISLTRLISAQTCFAAVLWKELYVHAAELGEACDSLAEELFDSEFVV